MLTGRWYRFGYACVNFGRLVSARDWLAMNGGDLRGFDRERRFGIIARLAADVMKQVASLVPVLPASLIATVLLEAEGPIDEFELKLRAGKLMSEFEAHGAKLYVPRGDRDYSIHVGLRMLALRYLVEERNGMFAAVPDDRPLLAYYANSVAHLRGR